MSLSASDVDRILQLLDSSSFDELELEMDGIKLALRRSSASAATAPASTVSRKRPDSPAPPAACEPQAAPASLPPGEVAVNAPLLGTFYRAPKPGAPPYVEVGSVVTPDSIIGIIEVMKLMNTVRAGAHGTVTRVVAQDGGLVEFGAVLLHLRTAD